MKPRKPKNALRSSASEDKETRRVRLVAESVSNPNGFFTYEETGIICNFGQDSMSALAGLGAPVAFRKMNPALVRAWIAENQALIRKLDQMQEDGK